MNSFDSFLFPASLDPLMQGAVQERLTLHRAGLLDSLLAKLQDPLAGERIGGRTRDLQGFISEILNLSAETHTQIVELVNHWAISFLLARLLADEACNNEFIDYLTSNLVALLLGRRLEGSCSSDRDVHFATTSSCYDLYGDVRIQLPSWIPARERIIWEFSDTIVMLRVDREEEPFLRLRLPIEVDGPIALRQLPKVKCWNIPVIDDISTLGFAEFQPAEGDPRYEDVGDYHPLRLEDSLKDACRILTDLWPGIVGWGEVLLPAFVDMGGPPSRSVHRSACYGPGTPIFLTKVSNPFEHAEDILHELQHQRLFLLFDTDAFGKWNDTRQRFASPYRPDPRPLRGVHMGLHAFLAVNRLRLLAANREKPSIEQCYQMLKTHHMNLFAFRTLLEHEDISPCGRRPFAEYAQELTLQHEAIESLATVGMSETIDRRLEKHVASVGASNMPIENPSTQYRNWSETVDLATQYVWNLTK